MQQVRNGYIHELHLSAETGEKLNSLALAHGKSVTTLLTGLINTLALAHEDGADRFLYVCVDKQFYKIVDKGNAKDI
jgi:hypothetical protein